MIPSTDLGVVSPSPGDCFTKVVRKIIKLNPLLNSRNIVKMDSYLRVTKDNISVTQQ